MNQALQVSLLKYKKNIKLEKQGENIVIVCKGPNCLKKGSLDIIKEIEKEFGDIVVEKKEEITVKDVPMFPSKQFKDDDVEILTEDNDGNPLPPF